jgi:uroporphyrinogen decarboxylase
MISLFGFILAPGCGLPPKSPPYNVWMMTEAVNDFGWYSRISGKVRQ